MANDLLFPASVIGSMPRPDFVKDLIADDCPYSGDDYERLMGAAIRSVVASRRLRGSMLSQMVSCDANRTLVSSPNWLTDSN